MGPSVDGVATRGRFFHKSVPGFLQGRVLIRFGSTCWLFGVFLVIKHCNKIRFTC